MPKQQGVPGSGINPSMAHKQYFDHGDSFPSLGGLFNGFYNILS